VNGEVHGGRPRPTGAVVPRKKKTDVLKEAGVVFHMARRTERTASTIDNRIVEL
jgi:hypothetical protein